MGGEQASKTLLSIQLSRAADVPEDEKKARALPRSRPATTRAMDPRYAAARLWVDGIIDPAQPAR